MPDGLLMNGHGGVQITNPLTAPYSFCNISLAMPHRIGGSAFTSPSTGLIYITDAESHGGGNSAETYLLNGSGGGWTTLSTCTINPSHIISRVPLGTRQGSSVTKYL